MPADMDNPKDPLLVSASWLAGLFFAFKSNYPSCFSSREDIISAAGLVTISHFNGSQADVVSAINLRITSVLNTDCSDEKFLAQYIFDFSRLALTKRRALDDNAQQEFLKRCMPVLYKEIWDASNNAKINHFPGELLKCANDFVSSTTTRP